MLHGNLSHEEVKMIANLRCLSCGRRRKKSHEKTHVFIGGCLDRYVAARIVEKYKHLEPRRVGS